MSTDLWQTIYDAAANEGSILHDDTVTAIAEAIQRSGDPGVAMAPPPQTVALIEQLRMALNTAHQVGHVSDRAMDELSRLMHSLEAALRAVAPPQDEIETPCPSRKDAQHCNCWYDGGECCSCGVGAVVAPRDAT